MRILIGIAHPGHVHFYKHAIWQFQEHGHKILIGGRDKDVTLELLDHYGFPYRVSSAIGNGRWGMFKEFLQRGGAFLRLIREFDPDVVTAIGGATIAPACRLLRKPLIVFDDTETVPKIAQFLEYRFASVICTPDCFMRDLGMRHIRYAGYHELAYTHPKWFAPDEGILDELGLSKDDKFFVIRFVSWGAAHDIGHSGFSHEGKRELVRCLSDLGRVIITSESPLPPEFEPYLMQISSTKIHDLLYFGSLYIGEGGTMASEAAILGTPSIYINPLTMGYIEEQEQKYGLLHQVTNERKAIELAVKLASDAGTFEEYQQKRQRLLADKIDVTTWMVEFVENYPVGRSGWAK